MTNIERREMQRGKYVEPAPYLQLIDGRAGLTPTSATLTSTSLSSLHQLTAIQDQGPLALDQISPVPRQWPFAYDQYHLTEQLNFFFAEDKMRNFQSLLILEAPSI